MNRPYIICHMVMSIDGKVTGDFLYRPECESGTEYYYEINRNYKADAFACGRITMEGSFTGGWYPDLTPFIGEKVSRTDYIGNPEAKFFAVAFDRTGKLGWKQNEIVDEDPGYGGSHIIEVLCEKHVTDEYLAYLQSIGVSYIFAGKEEMDIQVALDKLYQLFGIRKLLLEGGSVINGAFQREGVIDELSLVVVPVMAGKESKPLFEESKIEGYQIGEVEKKDGGVWIRWYK